MSDPFFKICDKYVSDLNEGGDSSEDFLEGREPSQVETIAGNFEDDYTIK